MIVNGALRNDQITYRHEAFATHDRVHCTRLTKHCDSLLVNLPLRNFLNSQRPRNIAMRCLSPSKTLQKHPMNYFSKSSGNDYQTSAIFELYFDTTDTVTTFLSSHKSKKTIITKASEISTLSENCHPQCPAELMGAVWLTGATYRLCSSYLALSISYAAACHTSARPTLLFASGWTLLCSTYYRSVSTLGYNDLH